jgi:diguanylate cyclase (GGDEF)-like protein
LQQDKAKMLSRIKTAFAADAEMKQDPSLQRRLIMTAAILIVTTLTFAAFAFINFEPNSYLLSIVNLTISISTALALYSLIVKKSFYFASYFVTALLFIFLVTFSYFAGNQSFGLIWTVCYPLFVIPILGLRKGMIMVVLFYSVIIPMAYLGIGEWDYGFWNIKGFVRFTIATVAVVYTTCFFEVSANSAYKTIQEIREKEKLHLIALEKLSVTDQLTGLSNRRYFDDHFAIERKRVKRYDSALSLIMIDIDHFKKINDAHGHQVGDSVLQEFSRIIQENVRTTDIISRWGGEEFIILLPATSSQNAMLIAEKIQSAVNAYRFSDVGHLTASFGVSNVDPNSTSNRESVNQADQALYEAKKQGRNRVVAYENMQQIDNDRQKAD